MLFLCYLENVIPDRISRRKSESAFFNISQELGMDEIFFFKKKLTLVDTSIVPPLLIDLVNFIQICT